MEEQQDSHRTVMLGGAHRKISHIGRGPGVAKQPSSLKHDHGRRSNVKK